MKTKYPVSDHCDGQKFFNPTHNQVKSFGSVLKWMLTSRRARWPKWRDVQQIKNLPRTTAASEMNVTFVNHATCLVQTSKLNIMTDPVFSKRVSPFRFIGPKRIHAPGIELKNLPRIHIVLISHNHYDHLDIESLRELDRMFQPVFVAPLGNRETLHDLRKVVELDWWETQSILGAEITLTPAHHWSGRWLNDRCLSLWGGFYVRTPQAPTLFFAGDTGYWEHFKKIKERLGAPHVSLLPVGAYEPRWFMKDAHMNPADAVQAHLDLGSKHSIPIHFGTFQLTDEAIDTPLQDLQKALAHLQVPSGEFQSLAVGETQCFRSLSVLAQAE